MFLQFPIPLPDLSHFTWLTWVQIAQFPWPEKEAIPPTPVHAENTPPDNEKTDKHERQQTSNQTAIMKSPPPVIQFLTMLLQMYYFSEINWYKKKHSQNLS